MARKVRVQYPGAIYRKEMLEHIEQQRGKWHYGQELCEAAHAKAERLIEQALQSEHLIQQHLKKWRKGHPFKVRLAAKLRAETTVTVSWLAERLNMGTRGHLAHLLFTYHRAQTQPSPTNQIRLAI
jgi:hypothetical protein